LLEYSGSGELTLRQNAIPTFEGEAAAETIQKFKRPTSQSAFTRNGKPALLLGGDCVLGSFCDAELHYSLGFDLDGFTSLRIASHAGLAVRFYQSP